MGLQSRDEYLASGWRQLRLRGKRAFVLRDRLAVSAPGLLLVVLMFFLKDSEWTLVSGVAFWVVGATLSAGIAVLFAHAEWEYREEQFRALCRARGLDVPEIPR